mgnify:CR=1 FL=1
MKGRGRIAGEKLVLEKMVGIYCRGNHRGPGLCRDCRALLDYGLGRLESCPHGENKPFCSRCRSHCYRADMRKAVRKVMRYSGPRMLFYGPGLFLAHLSGIRPGSKKRG